MSELGMQPGLSGWEILKLKQKGSLVGGLYA